MVIKRTIHRDTRTGRFCSTRTWKRSIKAHNKRCVRQTVLVPVSVRERRKPKAVPAHLGPPAPPITERGIAPRFEVPEPDIDQFGEGDTEEETEEY
jgi:hypothetical protein